MQWSPKATDAHAKQGRTDSVDSHPIERVSEVVVSLDLAAINRILHMERRQYFSCFWNRSLGEHRDLDIRQREDMTRFSLHGDGT